MLYFILILGGLAAGLSSAVEAVNLSLTEEKIQTLEKQYGEYAGRRLRAWQQLLTTPQNKSDVEKLKVVNQFFNQIHFVEDRIHWKQKDYWATPVEFLVTNGGDCEDFSIAKYFTLRALGVSDEKLQLTYVKAATIGQAHMVLTYFEAEGEIPLVLDNLMGEILPADKRPDLTPVYSFNGNGLWEAKERGRGRRLGDSKSLKRWGRVGDKMKALFAL